MNVHFIMIVLFLIYVYNPLFLFSLPFYFSSSLLNILFLILIIFFLWYINAAQFKDQTVITKVVTKLHVIIGIIFICCSLDSFRSLCHRCQISITWNGSQLLLHWCPLPTSFIGFSLGVAKVIGMDVYLPSFFQLQASNFTTKTQTLWSFKSYVHTADRKVASFAKIL